MTTLRTVLLIDDDYAHADVFREAVLHANDGPFQGEWVRTLAEGIARLKEKKTWAVFVNLWLPDSRGLETFDRVAASVGDVPVLVIGAVDDEDFALEALRRGAKDYLLEDHMDRYSLSRAIRNMAERKAAQEVLQAEGARARVMLDAMGDAVISIDFQGSVTYLNPAAEEMTGWTRGTALGMPVGEVFQIVDGMTRESCGDLIHVAIEENRAAALTPNCILIRRDRREFAIEESVALIQDRDGTASGAVIVFRDVSASRAVGAEMSRQAQHDALTLLPNRVLLKDRLSQAIAIACRNGTRVAVQYVDLDGFKQINDSLGHEVGDRLLQSVGKRLQACVRNSDTVSRQGGDEFVILLTEIAQACDAGIKAAKILDALLPLHEIEPHCLSVTASIGIATYPEDGRDAETLIKNADAAMYQAKQNGGNEYRFFKKEMNVRAAERQLVEGSLRYALERDEFLMHYQPKVDVATGEITGVEALLRWQHPARGLLGPPQFVSIAQDCGLMVPIGRWVLRESCRQAQAWQRAGLRPIGMAVNVSSMEFRSGDFIENVRAILGDSHLDPRHLELELKEDVLMQRAEIAVPVLWKLKALGVRLAIDGFGTGYSSLSYLKKFPIDTLKVDQSFVHEIDMETEDAAIIRAMILMGRSLKHRVVAEGVETAEQFAFLRAHGCDEAQGFHVSRPMPGPLFAKLLETGLPMSRRMQAPVTN